MSAKHTPGPWGWHTPATTAARYACYVTAGNQYIAAIYHVNNKREAHPNARLIASAPDLLEAAHNAVGVLMACCKPAGGVDDSHAIADAKAMLQAAIAKATGEQQ